MAYPVVVSSLTGLQLGDLMIGVASGDNFNGSFTPPNIGMPSGFTLIRDNAPVNYKEVQICWKYADAADVANPGGIGFSINNGASTGSSASATVCRITGARLSGFPNAISSADTSSTASITPTTQCLLLLVGGTAGPSGGAVISASGYAIAANNPSWTELVDAGNAGVGNSNKTQVFIAWANQTAAGGVATGIGSVSLTGGSVQMLALIAIDPLPITVGIFGSTFAVPAIVYVRKMVETIFGSLFTALAPASAGEVLNKWTQTAKGVVSAWTQTPK